MDAAERFHSAAPMVVMLNDSEAVSFTIPRARVLCITMGVSNVLKSGRKFD